MFEIHDSISLLLIPPSFSRYYDSGLLDLADYQRIKKKPALVSKLDWQTSRVGKYMARKYFPCQQICLSHKNNFSLIGLANYQIGVDLEWMQTKNYLAIARKIASSEEQKRLTQSHNQMLDFYRLWTMKEAIIKVENLNFPTAMKHVGFTWKNDARIIISEHQKVSKWFCIQVNESWLLSTACSSGKDIKNITLYTPNTVKISHLISNAPSLGIKQINLSSLAL